MSTSGPFPQRTFGVLLHPSSFPGRDGIGTLGDSARSFIEWLATTGAGIWQILPLTVNGKDDSPYFSSSAFAGNPWLIDLADLERHGLIDDPGLPEHETDAPVDFESLRRHKQPRLWEAADRFLASPDDPWHAEFETFVQDADWLTGTCHFFALKATAPDRAWWQWPEPLRRRDPDAVDASLHELADEIARWQAVFFFFEVQWREAARHAHERGIRVLGDLPIYVAPDSADVWLHQHQFQLDELGHLPVQSGVPPDYFSEMGQLWGNPLYRWDVMADDGYSWWLARLRRSLELSDIVRIDHFRALAAYWEVPGDALDARGGRWVQGPAQSFVDAIVAAFPDRPIVAEDLGLLDDDVHHLRDDNELPGMRVLQFAFDGDDHNMHLPHLLPERCIVYTGTHDNDTAASWWARLDGETRRRVASYLEIPPDADVARAVWKLIESAMGSRAIAAVIPVQDLLVLGEGARMNVPATTTGNWAWRMTPGQLDAELAASLRELGERHDRC
jgi:4-alpha-glucanotransferase